MPQPKPIPHHQPGYEFVSPVATPPPKAAKVPTYKRYQHIEAISKTENFTAPEVLVILGSGPKGRAAWGKIPKDSEVWALNEGVNIPIDYPKECAFKPAKWFVNDAGVLDKLYFPKANKNFKGIRVFGDLTLQRVRQKYLYTRNQIDAVREGRIFSIPRGPYNKAEQKNWSHDPLLFKPGGTVAAAALWVAYITGPSKRVYFCGIDMSMDLHYGETEEPANPDIRHGVEWGTSRPALDERIRHFKSQGMEIYTISESKLRNVEMREKVA